MLRFARALFCLILFLLLPLHGTAQAAGCTNPDGVAGQQMYNFTENVMQYCNGTEWRAVQGLALDDISPAAGHSQIVESTSVNCSGTLLPLVLSCTATCPDGFWRSGCFAGGAGTAVPTGERGCFCALADPQCTAFCLK